MTKIPRRARRFERRQEKLKQRPLLNLVAMMDVFTILVFFLLANYSDTMLSLDPDKVRLPESLATQQPRDTIVVTITPRDVLLQGHRVASSDAVLRSSASEIASLRTALEAQARDKPVTTAHSPLGGVPEVTIMGDKTIPFRLLKKVMVTCVGAGYGNISLSVLQRPLPAS
ncbi:MAG: ExbD/TolR family protein [Gammaproteobacteria bacterium]